MNTLQKQFRDSLKREGKDITTYYTSETIKCIFRKNNDNNSTDNHISIFYEVSAPIKQGQLLSYSGKHFITLNKESVENDTYYKSTLLECNLILPVVVNKVTHNIPCYMYDLTSNAIVGNDIIRYADGRVSLITESTDVVNNIKIETGFWIVGGYFELATMYNLNGITSIYLDRELMPQRVYAFDLTSSAIEYDVDTTTQLVPVPTIDGAIDNAATITYSSSNELIATVDLLGTVTFLAEGNVTITAAWKEQNLTDTIDLTVVAEVIVPENTFNLVCSNVNNEIVIGSTSGRIFTASMVDASGITVDFTPVWTFDWNGMATSNFTITYPSTYKCKVAVKDVMELIGKTFVITCTTSDGIYTKSIVMTLVSGW